jgi:hypothetical protein
VYQPGQAQNFTPDFTTSIGSLSVIVKQPSHGLTAGQMVWYPAPIAASGIIITGPYLVTSVVDFNNYEITVGMGTDGTGSVALPIFTAATGSRWPCISRPTGSTTDWHFTSIFPRLLGASNYLAA